MPHLAVTTLTGAALAAALLPTGAAHALPRPAEPGTVLKLTVTAPDGERGVALTCEPSGGTHPAAAAACADLARSNGRFSRHRLPAGTVCTMDHRPAKAEAKGTWRGGRVHYRETFGNACLLRARTGAIFRF